MSVLKKRLDVLIAKDCGVRPEEVTLEFIREMRKAQVYPRQRVDYRQYIGGYVAHGEITLTGKEAAILRDRDVSPLSRGRTKEG